MRALGRFLLWATIGLVLVIGGLRVTVLRWWKVPEEDPYLEASITPTLRGGDWVLLWRLTAPPLGSLVVCPEPKHPERFVVGRLVGEEGDEIKVDGTRLYVNGKALGGEGGCNEERFSVTSPHDGSLVDLRCSTEVINASVHERGEVEDAATMPLFETEVGPGEALLVSDNRRFPYDSRDFGPVDRRSCKESVFFRLVGREGFFSESRFSYIR